MRSSGRERGGKARPMALFAVPIAGAILVAAYMSAAMSSATLSSGQEFVLATIPMDKGDKIGYSFSASGNVEFSISQFGGNALLELSGSSGDGKFAAPAGCSYVVKVENPNLQTLTVDYSISEVDPPVMTALIVLSVSAVAVIVIVLVLIVTRLSSRRRSPRI